MLSNRIRAVRTELGCSQADLARQVGVSRQALSQVEAMRVIPNTSLALRLAKALGVSVETLFDESSANEVVVDEAASDHLIGVGERVVLLPPAMGCDSPTARRVPAVAAGSSPPSPPAVGVVTARTKAGRLTVNCPPGVTLQSSTLVAGCDLGLGLLAEHARGVSTSLLRSSSPVRTSTPASILWENADNRIALRLLSQGLVQVAGVHVPVEQTLPDLPNRQVLPHQPLLPTRPSLPPLVRLHFAQWQLGWMVRRGNPSGFGGAADLSSGRLRLANRGMGSGARALIDRLLLQDAVQTSTVAGYDSSFAGHLQVAETVAAGMADVGLGIASAAALVDLDFLPVQSEVCELWLPEENLAQDSVQRLLGTLQSDVFRWDLERFGPYDVSQTGQQLY